jgi:multicomponent Na+:H+ antiporter subunit E
MARSLYLILFLAIIWLLLSGHYTPLLLGLGAASCLLVWYISERMDLVDHEEHPLHLRPIRLILYWLWLGGEVVKSNIDVARRIIDPDLPIQPKLLKVRTSQRTELGQVIYANSITLTPGTVSIDLEGYEIEVHALAADPAEALLAGEMDRRVSAVERPQPEDPRSGQR